MKCIHPGCGKRVRSSVLIYAWGCAETDDKCKGCSQEIMVCRSHRWNIVIYCRNNIVNGIVDYHDAIVHSKYLITPRSTVLFSGNHSMCPYMMSVFIYEKIKDLIYYYVGTHKKFPFSFTYGPVWLMMCVNVYLYPSVFPNDIKNMITNYLEFTEPVELKLA